MQGHATEECRFLVHYTTDYGQDKGKEMNKQGLEKEQIGEKRKEDIKSFPTRFLSSGRVVGTYKKWLTVKENRNLAVEKDQGTSVSNKYAILRESQSMESEIGEAKTGVNEEDKECSGEEGKECSGHKGISHESDRGRKTFSDTDSEEVSKPDHVDENMESHAAKECRFLVHHTTDYGQDNGKKMNKQQLEKEQIGERRTEDIKSFPTRFLSSGRVVGTYKKWLTVKVNRNLPVEKDQGTSVSNKYVILGESQIMESEIGEAEIGVNEEDKEFSGEEDKECSGDKRILHESDRGRKAVSDTDNEEVSKPDHVDENMESKSLILGEEKIEQQAEEIKGDISDQPKVDERIGETYQVEEINMALVEVVIGDVVSINTLTGDQELDNNTNRLAEDI
ncbi:hypothetical protein HAX54_014924 [Datura stramonium]|uniref:Uncharacterized protein n=1 Tax=Datura stramonium TaxID=4076 RepID=A0ABS8RZR5_DATST|nr:hypothetical protein [Datura stramonium]